MSAYGMDVEQAMRLAGVMQRHSDDVVTLTTQIQHRIDALDWYGPDANRFRNEELARITGLMKRVARSAAELAQDADRNAKDQRRVSGS